ncbi:ABC transporter ATP-binding protein [Synechococcus sp. J7-Johnson]|uniref:ABC transporter ATP-binding protein n=1 Tax=Synechococcus sp. J7-Johnson TaxID=2823737 RepID=UPI0020CD4706|nr:ABC transporter ATP-binding protein [Synechococcus sp. J7-Johnson]MCP9840535.1 ABC transporter ATP-binding protein [Synechococcus sp. J7-Johnson]
MCSELPAARSLTNDEASPLSEDQAAVVVDGLSKVYRIYQHPRQRLLQALWGHRRRYYQEFWALQPLNFRLGRGQTLGIVGRNGSGKSTLLQLICGTLTPTSGHVRVRGRVGALLELGSGFNPEFSGRENVFLNGAVLGLSQDEIEAKLEAILSFADIGNFIDQPVKTYSSGMAVRLAFAVQAHIDPDVLVVDEALAVGDELFQKKCYAHLEKLKDQGTSILLVTHSCPQIVQHCDVALLMHKGKARRWGKPAEITALYQQLSHADDSHWDAIVGSNQDLDNSSGGEKNTGSGVHRLAQICAAHGQFSEMDLESSVRSTPYLDPKLQPASTMVYPSHGAIIEALEIRSMDGQIANVLPYGEPFMLEFHYRAEQHLSQVAFGCHVASHTGSRVTGQIHPERGELVPRIEAGHLWSIRFHFHGGLWPGTYFIGGGLWSPEGTQRFIHRVVDFKALRITASAEVGIVGQCDLHARPAELTSDDDEPCP